MAPTPPCPTARSVSSKIRFLSSALNLRRSGLTGTSGSGELVTKGTAILVSLTMILLAALLCNYGRGKCLIIIGTEGSGTTETCSNWQESAFSFEQRGGERASTTGSAERRTGRISRLAD